MSRLQILDTMAVEKESQYNYVIALRFLRSVCIMVSYARGLLCGIIQRKKG